MLYVDPMQKSLGNTHHIFPAKLFHIYQMISKSMKAQFLEIFLQHFISNHIIHPGTGIFVYDNVYKKIFKI